MKKTPILWIVAFLLILSVKSASAQSALSLTLEPAVQTINTGQGAMVNVVINGLGNFSPDSLGAFDIDISFDDTILNFDSVVFNTLLGDLSTEATTSVTSGVGSLEIFELSLLTDTALDVLQPSSFSLFTINFIGDNVGTSPVEFGDVELVDAAFPPSFLDGFAVYNASIEVTENVIPEPATMLLFGSGMVGAFLRRRKQA